VDLPTISGLAFTNQVLTFSRFWSPPRRKLHIHQVFSDRFGNRTFTTYTGPYTPKSVLNRSGVLLHMSRSCPMIMNSYDDNDQTNLVERPTSQVSSYHRSQEMHKLAITFFFFKQNELSRVEQLASVSPLLSKIVKYRPRIVCFVGLGIAQIIKSHVLPVSHTGYGFKRAHL